MNPDFVGKGNGFEFSLLFFVILKKTIKALQLDLLWQSSIKELFIYIKSLVLLRKTNLAPILRNL